MEYIGYLFATAFLCSCFYLADLIMRKDINSPPVFRFFPMKFSLRTVHEYHSPEKNLYIRVYALELFLITIPVQYSKWNSFK